MLIMKSRRILYRLISQFKEAASSVLCSDEEITINQEEEESVAIVM